MEPELRISVRCRHCHAMFHAPIGHAGRRRTCLACGELVRVPGERVQPRVALAPRPAGAPPPAFPTEPPDPRWRPDEDHYPTDPAGVLFGVGLIPSLVAMSLSGLWISLVGPGWLPMLLLGSGIVGAAKGTVKHLLAIRLPTRSRQLAS